MFISIPIIMYISSLTMLFISMLTMLSNHSLIIEWETFYIMSSKIKLELMLEWSGTLYSAIVMFISSNVLTFSKIYMSSDLNKLRFTHVLMCFILSMNILIFMPNILWMLIGWDGLGITSFILVIYYNNPRSLSAGMLTMLTNRLGDTFLLLSVATSMNTTNWSLLHSSPENKYFLLQWLGIMMAALTKSAQIPFSSWLPAAMTAPTPVSALVHSSTLVTAGVFIMYRFNSLVYYSPLMQTIIMVTSISTTMMAGMSAIYESDMKKIIALSTLSQLGLMMFPLSLNLPMLTFFHMSTHAMFKALLFIASGNMIMINNHNQDLRLYGQFLNTTPLSKSAMLLALSAMIGVPFMTGYYSKHAIMQWSTSHMINYILFLILMVTIIITSTYSSRMFLFTMMSPMNTMPSLYNLCGPHKNSSLTHMLTMSIMGGSSLQWFYPMSTMNSTNTNNNLTLIMNLIIMASAIILLQLLSQKKSISNNMSNLNTSMWFLIPMSTQLIIPPMYNLSTMFNKYLDQSWLELLTAKGTSSGALNFSAAANQLFQTHPMNNITSTTLFTMTFFIIMINF